MRHCAWRCPSVLASVVRARSLFVKEMNGSGEKKSVPTEKERERERESGETNFIPELFMGWCAVVARP